MAKQPEGSRAPRSKSPAARSTAEPLPSESWDIKKTISGLFEAAPKVATSAGLTFHFLSRDYLLRLAVALACFLLTAYINALASVIAGYRTPWVVIKDLDGNASGKVTLPDVGHDLSEALVVFLGFDYKLVEGWLMVNGFIIPDTLILRRALMVMSFVFLLRAFCVFVTQLPDAHPKCQAQFLNEFGKYKRQPMFPKAIWRAWEVFKHPADHLTCGDMVFSGHTSVLTLNSMIVFHYCRKEHLPGGPVFMKPLMFLTGNRFAPTEKCYRLVRLFSIIYTICGAAMIVATRLHYTLDVAIAVYLNTRSFRWYHDSIIYDKLKNRASIFLLYRSSLLKWLEAEEILSAESASLDMVSKAPGHSKPE